MARVEVWDQVKVGPGEKLFTFEITDKTDDYYNIFLYVYSLTAHCLTFDCSNSHCSISLVWICLEKKIFGSKFQKADWGC